MARSAVVIENPILNSPFEEPKRHFVFDDDGITDEIVEARRVLLVLHPDPAAEEEGQAARAPGVWTADRSRRTTSSTTSAAGSPSWRSGGYPGVTPTTARLLEYWSDPDRERGSSSARSRRWRRRSTSPRSPPQYGDSWIENDAARRATTTHNPGLQPDRVQDGDRHRARPS